MMPRHNYKKFAILGKLAIARKGYDIIVDDESYPLHIRGKAERAILDLNTIERDLRQHLGAKANESLSTKN